MLFKLTQYHAITLSAKQQQPASKRTYQFIAACHAKNLSSKDWQVNIPSHVGLGCAQLEGGAGLSHQPIIASDYYAEVGQKISHMQGVQKKKREHTEQMYVEHKEGL